jgi:hypothetical protein
MSMPRVRVAYHHEPPHGWWAESPDVAGWSASADDAATLATAVVDGLRFALDTEDIEVAPVVKVEPGHIALLDFSSGVAVSAERESESVRDVTSPTTALA